MSAIIFSLIAAAIATIQLVKWKTKFANAIDEPHLQLIYVSYISQTTCMKIAVMSSRSHVRIVLTSHEQHRESTLYSDSF